MKLTKNIHYDKTEYRNYHGQWHREDGPAVIWTSGHMSWWKNGIRHREDGPAIIRADSVAQWFLNGTEYSEEDYNHEIVKRNIKKLNI